VSDRAAVRAGWCAEEVQRELPGVRLLVCEVEPAGETALTAASPQQLRARLRELSDRFRGARAVGVRREAVPAAYRVFFRQIGLDPDAAPTPLEAAVRERMLMGGFPSAGLLADALLIALLDTGVPVWALDADAVAGELGIRASVEAEPFGRDRAAAALPGGRLVLADDTSALAILFGEIAPGHLPRARARRLLLFALQVEGVPALYAEEALWNAASALETRW